MTHNQPKFYPGEFEPPSHSGLIIILVTLAVISHGAAIWFGMWLKGEQFARQQRAAQMQLKPAVQRANPPAPLLSCSARDRAEYTQACQDRARSERVTWLEAAR